MEPIMEQSIEANKKLTLRHRDAWIAELTLSMLSMPDIATYAQQAPVLMNAAHAGAISNHWLHVLLRCAGVGLLPYALSSSVAIVPWSITFVYFGSMAKNMADILEGRAGPHGASSVALLAMSGVMLVAVVVYSTIIAR